MSTREKIRQSVKELIVAAAPRLFYLRRGNEVVAELTREVALSLLTTLSEYAKTRVQYSVVERSDTRVVLLCRLTVTAPDFETEVEEVGEADLSAASDKQTAQVAERMYRTAATRALKRAVELVVGDINALMVGLAQLYAVKNAPPVVLPVLADYVEALGLKQLTLDEFKQIAREYASRNQN